MNNLKDGLFTVGTGYETAFRCEAGVYQDGTVPFFRDSDGILWAMAGHSHLGHIGVFCGTALSYMREVYPAALKFGTGAAGDAFNGIPYPEGIRSRGSVWPFGLYICPGTGRFFCFFHKFIVTI